MVAMVVFFYYKETHGKDKKRKEKKRKGNP
jgi:hypothetical protein